MRRPLLVAVAALAVGACSADDLEVQNPNSPTPDAAATDPTALQLQATGILRQNRGTNANGDVFGRFGREAYVYTPTEGRNTSHYLIGIAGENRLDPAGFATGVWGGPYGNRRDIFNFLNAIDASSLTNEQKNAARGFARTIEALEMLYVIAARDTLGAVIDISANPSDLAPFVPRDSVYRWIAGTLDAANTLLAGGGAAFPFVLHAGFNGFNTPATFARFNRAIAARAAAYHATSGGGTAAWQRALTALNASFINLAATSVAALEAGPSHVYANVTGDASNPYNKATNTNLFAHMSIQADAQLRADGSRDARYTRKVGPRPERSAPQGFGVPSSLGFEQWPTVDSPYPIITNEELILLRAEALLATGDKAGALQMINLVRTVSGGLPASTLTAASPDADFITAILYEKRYSLLLLGHRWVDHRRYGRLNQLPLDISTGTNRHFVARVMPVPQAECLVRARANDAALAGPGC
jgi:hypothetical protein